MINQLADNCIYSSVLQVYLYPLLYLVLMYQTPPFIAVLDHDCLKLGLDVSLYSNYC